MPNELTQTRINSLTRFKITRFQYLLIVAATLSLIGFGYTTVSESSISIREAKVLSDVETPAASIIFTQRETLVFATRLAQWSNGGTTRRSVQISRNLLAQRLAVIDSSGESMGSRAPQGYWDALREADAIVASAVPGILPEALHKPINNQISPVIDQILLEARNLVVSYQRSVDQEMAANAKRVAEGDRHVLQFFLLFILLSGIFLVTNIRTNFKVYRQVQQTIKDEQAKLEATIRDLHETQDKLTQLQDLDQAKNAFISTVNHELRTPLTSIIGYIEVIREEEEKLGHDITGYLDVLDRNAQILLNLVESMLSLSKIDADRGIVNHSRVSLNDVIESALFVMRPAIEKSDIRIKRIDLDQGSFYVKGDEGQLNQVFLNLLGNAIKFSPEASEILITTSHKSVDGDDFISVEVRDQGIGIPKEDLDHLFTRFFRAKNAVSQQIQGTGLGLAIVSQALNLHGATIGVESEEGVGTAFTLTFPLFLTEEEEMIVARRADVLRRTIARLEEATQESIEADAHELGGAIGFYGYTVEGEALLAISKDVANDSTSTLEELPVVLKQIVESLQRHLEKLEEKNHE